MTRARPIGPRRPAASALALFAMVLSASPAAGSAAASQPANGASKKASSDPCRPGKRHYAAGDVLKAIEALERCVEVGSSDRDAWVLLATARMEAGRFGESVDAFARAERLGSGDEAFLASYLSALEGAGRSADRVRVLRALADVSAEGAAYAERLLALADSLGGASHADDRLHALEKLSQRPGAENLYLEKLAAAYLERGEFAKAGSEYRGLLSRRPENGEYWAGLAASIGNEDRAAALDCYRKALFYSNQATARAAYRKRIETLESPSAKVATAPAQDSKTEDIPKPTDSKSPVPSVASKPFDIKAFQDSVFEAELAKRLAALKMSEPAPSVAKTTKKEGMGTRSQEDQEKKAEEEKLRKAEAERKAEADKAAAEEKARKERKAEAEQLENERLEKERIAVREKEEADRKSRSERERLEKRAEAERKAAAEKEERDRLAHQKQGRHDSAIAWYKAGRLDSADRLFKTVLKENPSPEAWFYAGRANLDQGRWKRALKYFDKSPADMRDIDRFRGQAYLKIGKKKEALIALERHHERVRDPKVLEEICAIKKETEPGAGRLACLEKLTVVRPSDVKLHQELAVLYRMAGENGKSLEREALTVALEPAHGEANYRLGLDWSSQGVHDRAVPHLEHAVTAFPARGDAWKALAKGQAALGRKGDAVRSFAKAAALMPDDLDIARGRQALARESSEGKELEEAYRGVLRIAPTDPEAALGLARLRYRAGDYAAAESHFRIGLGGSRDAILWGEFGRSLLETKKPEAAAALRKALDLGDTSRALRFDLARLHMDRGEADTAEALLKEMSSRDPADPEPYYWLARIAGLRKQAAVQEELFRKANQLAPSEGRYAESLGALLRDRDEFAQAAATLRLAEAALGQSGLVLLADCLARSGQGESALAIYDSLFRKEPGPVLLARRLDAQVALGRPDAAVDAARGSAFADRGEVRFSLAKAHIALAESHVIRGDLEQAVSLMKGVLRADRHRPEFHYHLGRAWFLQKRYKKAARAFTDAMRYRMDYPEAVYGKGLCLLELGRAGESRNFFGELSQQADPRWKSRGLGGLARVFEAEGKWEAVEHHLVRSVGVFPHADAMAELSRVNLKLGRVKEAEEWAAKALELDSSHVAGNLALAEALASRRKLPEALDVTETALRAKPLSCRLLVQTAKLNLEAGNLDSTLAASGKAIQACPQDPQAHFYAGMASHGANRPADAKRHFKSYSKLGGDRSKIPD